MSVTLDQIPPLLSGNHDGPDSGMCVMEAVSWIAREPWSDHPECVCPVIGAFLRIWNDSLPDADRDRLLRPLITIVINTRSTPAVERRRATMAADWLIREHTPTWLRLAGLTTQAEALVSLSEITDFAQCLSIMPTLTAVRKDATAAKAAAVDAAKAAAGAAAVDAALDAAVDAGWAAAGDAAWAAAWAAAWDAAGGATRGATRAAAEAAAWAAAWDAAKAAAVDAAKAAAEAAAVDAAWAAAGDAAWDAAVAAAWAAAWADLHNTAQHLQQSALTLVRRMINLEAA
jgi:hypothetical protein